MYVFHQECHMNAGVSKPMNMWRMKMLAIGGFQKPPLIMDMCFSAAFIELRMYIFSIK